MSRPRVLLAVHVRTLAMIGRSDLGAFERALNKPRSPLEL